MQKKQKIIIGSIIGVLLIALLVSLFFNFSSTNRANKKISSKSSIGKKASSDKSDEVNSDNSDTVIDDTSSNMFSDNEVVDDDTIVASYIDSVTNEDISNTSKGKLTNSFVCLTDFIFYGGTIKGKTFNDLSDSLKEKVISSYNMFDSKISSKYPDYKESIKTSGGRVYTNVKEMASSIIDSIRKKSSDSKYEDVVDSYNDDKSTVGSVYSTIKGKVSSWYQGIKDGSE